MPGAKHSVLFEANTAGYPRAVGRSTLAAMLLRQGDEMATGDVSTPEAKPDLRARLQRSGRDSEQ